MKHDGIKLIEWDFFCRRFTCENYHFLSLYSCLFKLHTPSLLIRPSIIIFCLRCCCFRICHFSSTILYLMRREVRINILTSLWKVQQKIEVTPGFDFFFFEMSLGSDGSSFIGNICFWVSFNSTHFTNSYYLHKF